MKRDSYLVGRAFRSFLFASVLTVAASQMGAFIDGLMVSWFVNDTAMGAINVSTPVLQLFFSLCLLLGAGGTLIAGKAIGNHDRQRASAIFSLSTSTAVVIGLVLGVAGLLFFNPIVSLLCPDSAVAGYVSDYLIITIPGAALYMLMIVLQMFVALDGEPKRVTVAVTTCVAVNLALDYLFIPVFGWGTAGAAAATVISYLPSIVILLMHFRKKGTLRFTRAMSLKDICEIARMGTPSGFTGLLMSVQIYFCNIVAINFLGTAGVIVLAVYMYLLRLSMILLTGTIDSFQPVASILAGSGDNRGVAMVLKKAYRFMGIALAVYVGAMILFPDFVASLFGITDGMTRAVVSIAIPAFAVNIILQCLIGLLISVYQVYSHTRQAMIVSVGQPLFPMLFFFLMAVVGQKTGTPVAWWGFAIGQVALIIVLLPFVMRRKNKTGACVPFFLIPVQSADKVYDTSLEPSMRIAGNQLVEADRWLADNGVADSLRFRVGVSCEEILKNIIDYSGNASTRPSIDLRISLRPGEVIAVIHDEGHPFNPVEEDPGTGIGLLIVRKSCDTMKYEYLFHQNILTMTWKTDDAEKQLTTPKKL